MLPKSSSHSAIQLLCPFLDKSQKLALAQFSDFSGFSILLSLAAAGAGWKNCCAGT